MHNNKSIDIYLLTLNQEQRFTDNIIHKNMNGQALMIIM